EPFFYLFT
ncbi:hypothetical protein D018_1799B, partial [Vibrio parahaemolyticus VP2007-007]